MDLTKFYTGDKFGFLIDFRPLADTKLQGSDVRLVNTKDGVFLELDRNYLWLGKSEMPRHVFTISDSQMNIMDRQLQSGQN